MEIDHKIVEHPYFMSSGHYHDFYELYFLIRGETRYQIGDAVYTLSPGDVMAVPTAVLHNTSNLNRQETERVLLTFSEEELMGERSLLRCFSEGLIRPREEDQAQIAQLLMQIRKEHDSTQPFAQTVMRASLLMLLSILCRQESAEIATPPGLEADILPIKRYIDEHWGEAITLSALGRRFAMNPCYLSRKFHSSMGFGLQEYIALVRMMHAEQMLVRTHRTVAEIAEACGFSTPNYFSLVFKRIHGASPLSYRKTHQQ